jgi:hypothetical protein
MPRSPFFRRKPAKRRFRPPPPFATHLAQFQGAIRWGRIPGVSLRSTPGYRLPILRIKDTPWLRFRNSKIMGLSSAITSVNFTKRSSKNMKLIALSILVTSTLLCGALCLSAQTIPANLTAGLVAYYPFDGNANDSSGNANNGTPAGNYQFLAAGKHGGSIRIIGDNSLTYSGGGHVLLPTFGNALDGGFTFSFWAKDEVIGGSPVNGEAY